MNGDYETAGGNEMARAAAAMNTAVPGAKILRTTKVMRMARLSRRSTRAVRPKKTHETMWASAGDVMSQSESPAVASNVARTSRPPDARYRPRLHACSIKSGNHNVGSQSMAQARSKYGEAFAQRTDEGNQVTLALTCLESRYSQNKTCRMSRDHETTCDNDTTRAASATNTAVSGVEAVQTKSSRRMDILSRRSIRAARQKKVHETMWASAGDVISQSESPAVASNISRTPRPPDAGYRPELHACSTKSGNHNLESQSMGHVTSQGVERGGISSAALTQACCEEAASVPSGQQECVSTTSQLVSSEKDAHGPFEIVVAMPTTTPDHFSLSAAKQGRNDGRDACVGFGLVDNDAREFPVGGRHLPGCLPLGPFVVRSTEMSPSLQRASVQELTTAVSSTRSAGSDSNGLPSGDFRCSPATATATPLDHTAAAELVRGTGPWDVANARVRSVGGEINRAQTEESNPGESDPTWSDQLKNTDALARESQHRESDALGIFSSVYLVPKGEQGEGVVSTTFSNASASTGGPGGQASDITRKYSAPRSSVEYDPTDVVVAEGNEAASSVPRDVSPAGAGVGAVLTTKITGLEEKNYGGASDVEVESCIAVETLQPFRASSEIGVNNADRDACEANVIAEIRERRPVDILCDTKQGARMATVSCSGEGEWGAAVKEAPVLRRSARRRSKGSVLRETRITKLSRWSRRVPGEIGATATTRDEVTDKNSGKLSVAKVEAVEGLVLPEPLMAVGLSSSTTMEVTFLDDQGDKQCALESFSSLSDKAVAVDRRAPVPLAPSSDGLCGSGAKGIKRPDYPGSSEHQENDPTKQLPTFRCPPRQRTAFAQRTDEGNQVTLALTCLKSRYSQNKTCRMSRDHETTCENDTTRAASATNTAVSGVEAVQTKSSRCIDRLIRRSIRAARQKRVHETMWASAGDVMSKSESFAVASNVARTPRPPDARYRPELHACSTKSGNHNLESQSMGHVTSQGVERGGISSAALTQACCEEAASVPSGQQECVSTTSQLVSSEKDAHGPFEVGVAMPTTTPDHFSLSAAKQGRNDGRDACVGFGPVNNDAREFPVGGRHLPGCLPLGPFVVRSTEMSPSLQRASVQELTTAVSSTRSAGSDSNGLPSGDFRCSPATATATPLDHTAAAEFVRGTGPWDVANAPVRSVDGEINRAQTEESNPGESDPTWSDQLKNTDALARESQHRESDALGIFSSVYLVPKGEQCEGVVSTTFSNASASTGGPGGQASDITRKYSAPRSSVEYDPTDVVVAEGNETSSSVPRDVSPAGAGVGAVLTTKITGLEENNYGGASDVEVRSCIAVETLQPFRASSEIGANNADRDVCEANVAAEIRERRPVDILCDTKQGGPMVTASCSGEGDRGAAVKEAPVLRRSARRRSKGSVLRETHIAKLSRWNSEVPGEIGVTTKTRDEMTFKNSGKLSVAKVEAVEGLVLPEPLMAVGLSSSASMEATFLDDQGDKESALEIAPPSDKAVAVDRRAPAAASATCSAGSDSNGLPSGDLRCSPATATATPLDHTPEAEFMRGTGPWDVANAPVRSVDGEINRAQTEESNPVESGPTWPDQLKNTDALARESQHRESDALDIFSSVYLVPKGEQYEGVIATALSNPSTSTGGPGGQASDITRKYSAPRSSVEYDPMDVVVAEGNETASSVPRDVSPAGAGVGAILTTKITGLEEKNYGGASDVEVGSCIAVETLQPFRASSEILANNADRDACEANDTAEIRERRPVDILCDTKQGARMATASCFGEGERGAAVKEAPVLRRSARRRSMGLVLRETRIAKLSRWNPRVPGEIGVTATTRDEVTDKNSGKLSVAKVEAVEGLVLPELLMAVGLSSSTTMEATFLDDKGDKQCASEIAPPSDKAVAVDRRAPVPLAPSSDGLCGSGAKAIKHPAYPGYSEHQENDPTKQPPTFRRSPRLPSMAATPRRVLTQGSASVCADSSQFRCENVAKDACSKLAVSSGVRHQSVCYTIRQSNVLPPASSGDVPEQGTVLADEGSVGSRRGTTGEDSLSTAGCTSESLRIEVFKKDPAVRRPTRLRSKGVMISKGESVVLPLRGHCGVIADVVQECMSRVEGVGVEATTGLDRKIEPLPSLLAAIEAAEACCIKHERRSSAGTEKLHTTEAKKRVRICAFDLSAVDMPRDKTDGSQLPAEDVARCLNRVVEAQSVVREALRARSNGCKEWGATWGAFLRELRALTVRGESEMIVAGGGCEGSRGDEETTEHSEMERREAARFLLAELEPLETSEGPVYTALGEKLGHFLASLVRFKLRTLFNPPPEKLSKADSDVSDKTIFSGRSAGVAGPSHFSKVHEMVELGQMQPNAILAKALRRLYGYPGESAVQLVVEAEGFLAEAIFRQWTFHMATLAEEARRHLIAIADIVDAVRARQFLRSLLELDVVRLAITAAGGWSHVETLASNLKKVMDSADIHAPLTLLSDIEGLQRWLGNDDLWPSRAEEVLQQMLAFLAPVTENPKKRWRTGNGAVGLLREAALEAKHRLLFPAVKVVEGVTKAMTEKGRSSSARGDRRRKRGASGAKLPRPTSSKKGHRRASIM